MGIWFGKNVGLLQPSRRTFCQRIRTAKPASSGDAQREHPHIPRRGPAIPPTEQDGLARPGFDGWDMMRHYMSTTVSAPSQDSLELGLSKVK